uniref:Uncharacterized protein n=1 Tax=viral metagenome TaxID=1070528 RepID=A0A6C0BQ86_9ZZZZ
MGQQACKNLHDLSNICDIWLCATKVQDIKSESGSPSIQFLVDFKPNVNYMNIPIERGFLKVFPSIPTSKMIQGLQYEIKVYRDVVSPLVNYNVCPNFIRYLASGSCGLREFYYYFKSDEVSISATARHP